MSIALAALPMPAEPSSAQPFVLVASEDHADWSAMRRLLGEGGYGLVRASSEREFERALRELPVAAVVCEDRPFGGSWRDVVQRVRRESRRPAVIVCSPRADEALWLDVLDHGGYDVFAKPIPTRLFRDRVENAVADWIWKPDAA